jgi:ABC-type branched-subunit amino acid transport system ATPase component/branched-subunit amino acid ABC-type transport system permease component
MSSYLPFIFLGIASGSIYALAGIGLVLTYKTSGIFNFAHGALATAAAYIFYTLHVQHGVAWPIAALVAGLVLGLALGLGYERLGRGLARTPMVWRVTATVGILISVQGLFTILYGSTALQFPHFLPNSTFDVFGAQLSWEQLIIAVFALAATVGMSLFFRRTRTGIAMRAVVDDPDNLGLTGTEPTRVRRAAWVIGCTFATLSGLLLAPSVSLDPTVLTLLIIQAFGAAAIGGFSSLPLTYLGGIGIGVAAAVMSKFANGSNSVFTGLPPSLPFLVLFLVLIVARRGGLGTREVAVRTRAMPRRAPWRAQLAGGAVALAALASVPWLVGYQLDQWTLMLGTFVLMLSLGLLSRWSGQVSLCQVTFAAIGAAAFSKLQQAGVPWLPALAVAGLVAVPIGAVLAIPAIRRSGLYLALATFGFGILVENLFYNTNLMFGSLGTGSNISRPGIPALSGSTGYYYVVLVIAAVLALFVVALARGRLGRLLRGVADSPIALHAQGARVAVSLVIVFCIAAFIAAVSGGLTGAVLGTVGGENFDPLTSLLYLGAIMIVGGGEPWYALFAAIPIALLPVYVTSVETLNYLSLAAGAAAVYVALNGQPKWPALERLAERLFGGRRRLPGLVPSVGGIAGKLAGAALEPVYQPVTFEASEVTVRFGGLLAVNGCSARLESGEIVGLIGPNGAGKSTMLNVCAGLQRPQAGQLRLDGRSVTRLRSAALARRGIGRTFQKIELFDTLSVRENLVLGCEAAMAGRGVVGQVVARRGEKRRVEARVRQAAELCDVTALLDQQAASLTTGQRRMVEFARCLAGDFPVLLLDEPASGLNRYETEKFGTVLRGVVEQRNLAVMLVEHDMDLVMEVCDRIYVMEFGKVIFTGAPHEVRQSELVRAAYLGTASAESGAIEAGADRPGQADHPSDEAVL